ncbi:MAG: hypothetical protein IPK83_06345 [Planctomycetes bacterium]|nr:hypothetical protein [Planctomycetota bacterium]
MMTNALSSLSSIDANAMAGSVLRWLGLSLVYGTLLAAFTWVVLKTAFRKSGLLFGRDLDGCSAEIHHSRRPRDSLLAGNFDGFNSSNSESRRHRANTHWRIRHRKQRCSVHHDI